MNSRSVIPPNLVTLLAAPAWAVGMVLCAASLVSAADKIDAVTFNRHIRPILVSHCVACHGGPKQAGGVSFLHRQAALGIGDSGEKTISPGAPNASEVMRRVTTSDESFRMPPTDHGPPLSDREVSLLRAWISQGAAWEAHWSFVPLQKTPDPAVEDESWTRAPLDRHTLARLEKNGLSPSPPADRAQWLRRVSFDLTGLPPTRAEQQAFLNDQSVEAHEQVIDRLLASPRFGERWTAMWLDLARYSDTSGYEKDPRRNIWPFRDWLIRALNDDLPYDEFIVRVLAGDLLPDATLGDRLATAFHRNTQTNTEGGTDDEEFRVAAVIDRVNTTWQVFQGATFGCAQCHSHPYDAFTNQDYYSFLALFNNTQDCDLSGEAPLLPVPAAISEQTSCGEAVANRRRLASELFAMAQPLMTDDHAWHNLRILQARSSKSTQLTTRRQGDIEELLATGTISAGSQYTVDASPPEGCGPITAIKIEALPLDMAKALQTPEEGFAVSRLRLYVTKPGGEQDAQEVPFAAAFCDDPLPLFDPEDSLRDNKSGWSAFTKIYRPRSAVFVLQEPCHLAPGDQLRVHLRQDRQTTGSGAQVIRRGRFYVTDSERWHLLLGDEHYVKKRELIQECRNKINQVAATRVPVMRERAAAHARNTYLFVRGNWLDLGSPALPGVPACMPAPSDGSVASRLDVARWIASEKNPLTSRTMVNRVWEQLFGIGIVETVGDLGASGSPPSNQALLDSLALRFQGDMRWSLKALLKEIVLSATYMQDSHATTELARRDPRNTLLARGPRLRLQAEMIRDQALSLSGKLSAKMYGPPVMPHQPNGVWQSVYSGDAWRLSQGEDRYRRAVYTFWKRTSPYPSLIAFDAPTREVCSVNRTATNTPLQALVTMNDPAFIELAQAFAHRIQSQGGASLEEQITWAIESATGRTPRENDIRELTGLYRSALGEPSEDTDATANRSQARRALAMRIVASAILNLDESLTK